MVLVLVFLVVFVGLAISVTGVRRGGLRRRFWPTPDTTGLAAPGRRDGGTGGGGADGHTGGTADSDGSAAGGGRR